jgi:hypothetical protein
VLLWVFIYEPNSLLDRQCLEVRDNFSVIYRLYLIKSVHIIYLTNFAAL